MTIDRSLRLPLGQYYSRAHKKTAVCLHHTVGGSAESSYRWWVQDPRVVGTAYLVDRDGSVLEVFPPECWAGHLACHDPALERATIGIELASEGALTLEPDGNLYAYDGKRMLGDATTLLGQGRVVRLERPWRGYQWFDAYEEAQVAAAIALVGELVERFAIARHLPRDVAHPDGNPRPYVGFQGIFHHACVRPDKSDLHPLFPWHRLAAALGIPWQAAA